MRQPSIVGVFSSRPDGATTVALGLAARLSEDRRSLLVDLASERPEVAPLLNLGEAAGVRQLAHRTQLVGVSPEELTAHVQWRDGMGVLVGTQLPQEPLREVTSGFMDDLMAVAASQFDHVVVDLGRPRDSLPSSIANGRLLWVVTPSPLGLVALERSINQLHLRGSEWIGRSSVVLNRVSKRSWKGVDRFIEREYRMEVAGQLPLTPAFWDSVEVTHSVRALSVPMPDASAFLRAHGTDALIARRALGRLRDAVAGSRRDTSRRAQEA